MKRLPEKLMIAAIILSCGFVMQSEPTKENLQKDGGFRTRRMDDAAQAALQTARRTEPSRRGEDSSP